jgi:hypothetical protein
MRYARLSRRAAVGAKRNLACEMADGSLIVYWDDDGPSTIAFGGFYMFTVGFLSRRGFAR